MKHSQSISTRIVNFLGSMNLAISLLVILAIASVIGTVLQQNQPYTDYQIKFGPFWFDIFRTLGLFDVYSAVWFLLILGFLVISTTTCVGRNTPSLLRELRHFRENVQEKSLRAMKNQHTLETELPPEEVQSLTARILKARGFKTRNKKAENHTVVAAMKGGANHWGYLLTHIGIIVICLGGLMDSRLPMMIAEWQGNLKPETRNIPASEVPKISQLGSDNYSYRGSVDIPEGSRANVIFLPVRDGYLVQYLPFEVEVKDFRVEHYSTGQPKSFESDIVVYDKELAEPLETTISVNHPLIHKGVAIYQASFGDGGSVINFKMHPFDAQTPAVDLQGKVFRDYPLTHNGQQFTLEVNDFRLFNINDMEQDDGSFEKQNIGPSVTFKLRDATGQALEYQNYMNPITLKGQHYFISGVRTSQAEPFRYLHIPVDSTGGLGRFMRFLANIQNPELVRQAALDTTRSSMQEAAVDQNTTMEQQVVDSMVRLVDVFARKGSEGVMQEIDSRFPEEQREGAAEAFMKVLNAALRAIYQQTLQAENINEVGEKEWLFFDDSLLVIDKISAYGSAWFMQMTDFKQIEASGLQITRSPGKDIVYLGSVMLTLGVFLLFYVAHRRIWVWIKPQADGRTQITLAGSTNRQAPEFERYFASLQDTFGQIMNKR